MNFRLLVLTALSSFLITGVSAQRDGIRDSGIGSMMTDSVRPWSTFGADLNGNWQDSAYSAAIEFPELSELNEGLLEKWGLTVDDIPEWPVVSVSIGESRGNATINAGFMPLLKRDGQIYAINSYKHTFNVSYAGLRVAATAPDSAYTRKSRLSEGTWVKIRVSESGLYKLTDKALKSMGFKDPSKVRLFGYGGAVLPETNIKNLIDDLPEQTLWRAEGFSLFYAQGPVSWKKIGKGYVHEVNSYSDYGYYFLTDNAEGERAEVGTLLTDSLPGSLTETYPDFEVYDPDEFSWYRSGRRMFESYDYANGSGRSYNFSLPGIIADSVEVTVAFSASAATVTTLNVSVNGSETGVVKIGANGSSDVARVVEKSLVSRNQFNENSQVRLIYNSVPGVSAHLDYIRLGFNRRLSLNGASTVFRTGADADSLSFMIGGTNADATVLRIGADGTVDYVPSVYSSGSTVTLGASYKADDRLVVFNPKGGFPEPQVMGKIENQNLHGLDSVDMVIVVPASGKLTAQAERLAAAHRTLDSLKVVVVRADMVYNEFSSGTPDATALRRFMKMLYDRGGADDSPRYLLLMGNGAWDNRMHVSDWAGNNPDDYLLCYESYNSVSHTDSYVMEDYFGLLDDSEGVNLLTEKVDIGVGRLPVFTAAEASKQVDKIIDYMSGKYAGEWCNRILVLGDDGDNNTHMIDADDVAELYSELYPAVDVRKIFWDAYKMEVTASYNGYPSVRKQLIEQLDKGALIVDYSGHGSTEVLSHELVLNKADMRELKSPRLPFWITASCDIAPFDSPLESMGMNLIGNTEGGAIGMLSTTRTVYASLNRTINRSFSRYVLAADESGRRYALGDALRLAKNELVTAGAGESDMTANKIHYVLLGDPAVRLALPELTAVIDSFAGAPASATGAAKAGAVVTVCGHIERNGVRVDGFNGELSATVYDNERQITCYNNLKTADEPFSFRYRDRILHSGTDLVRDGRFSFSFPVPLDINYSGENGRITLYAQSSEGNMSANGLYENFTVGGTAAGIAVDSIGPDIRLYLNTPSFQYGGSVNATPLLVAELSDSSGLNTSGNGLGHDILLIIDNNPNWTWVLNSNYSQAPGDYTRGSVTFSIPELPDGKHEIMLRAWDMMNNSTTVYLGFKVVSDLKPQFMVDVTESPARESTTFVVTHDRPGQDTKITVQVFSSDGAAQWTGSTVDSSASGVAMIRWNLHGSSGHRMQPGLYFVKATVGTGGGSGSASCKLVIVGP